MAYIQVEKFDKLGKQCSMLNPGTASGNVFHLTCNDCSSCYYHGHKRKDCWVIEYAVEEHYNIQGEYQVDCVPIGSMSSSQLLSNEAFSCLLSQNKSSRHPTRVGTQSL